jgi:hypothetical protein
LNLTTTCSKVNHIVELFFSLAMTLQKPQVAIVNAMQPEGVIQPTVGDFQDRRHDY